MCVRVCVCVCVCACSCAERSLCCSGGGWSRKLDAAVVRYVVALAEQNQCSALDVSEGMVLSAPPLADRHPQLAARGIQSLLQRIELLRYFNAQLANVAYWLDLSAGDAARATTANMTRHVPRAQTAEAVAAAVARDAAQSTPLDMFGGKLTKRDDDDDDDDNNAVDGNARVSDTDYEAVARQLLAEPLQVCFFFLLLCHYFC
jgi:hypothetical protein